MDSVGKVIFFVRIRAIARNALMKNHLAIFGDRVCSK